MIKDRIEQIITHFDITASELADKVDVQRSSISHITSGRNKPSAQFIQNLLNEFPEINARWFITGVGEMFNTPQNIQKPKESVKQLSLLDEQISYAKKPAETSSSNPPIEPKKEEKVPKSGVEDSDIDKIIVFYSDKTFETYSPRS